MATWNDTAGSKDAQEIDFPSWDAFLAHGDTADAHSCFRSERSSRGSGRDSFYGQEVGSESWEACLNVARNGWPTGEEIIRERTKHLVDKLASRIAQTEYYYAVAGEEFDMARVISGRPDCWMREEITHVEGSALRHVRVLVNTGATQGVRVASMQARGLAVAAATLLLERAGCRVSLDVVSAAQAYYRGTGEPEPHCTIRVRVKEPEQSLDEGRLAFCCVHPSMHRRMMFAVRETVTNDHLASALRGSYGSTCQVPTTGYDIYMPGMRESDSQPCNWNDTRAVEAWILETLKTQGVELNA